MQKLNEFLLLFCADAECSSKVLTTLIDFYKTTLYSYNTMIKNYGVYLKPVHIVVKKNSQNTKVYHYYGRYWYKVVYENGKLRWIYIGKEKPFLELPDPPLNPLLVIKVIASEKNISCVYIDKSYMVWNVLQYFKEAIDKAGCVKSMKW